MDAMAGESDIIGQAEIEALLRQARGASQQSPSSNPVTGPMRQVEIDSTVSGTGSTPTTPTPRTQPDSTTSDGHSPGNEIQFLLDQAEAAIASVNQPNPTPVGLSPFPLTDLASSPASPEKATLDLLRDVELGL